MKRAPAYSLLCAAILMLASLAHAQMQAPQPGPELKKLDSFIGSWKMEGEMKPGPMGPGGKFTGSTKYEWMPGGFFVEAHEAFNTPMGDGTALSFLGYDTNDKVYTYHSFASTGEAESATGTLDGDTWNWSSTEKMGGQEIKTRYTMKILSPTAYQFQYEVSPDGANWSTVMEGKATKQ